MDTDIRILEVRPYFNAEKFRTPLRFGAGEIRTITSFSVEILAENKKGSRARGFGNILLSDLWAFPGGSLSHEEKDSVMQALCLAFCGVYQNFNAFAHPVDAAFQLQDELLVKREEAERNLNLPEKIPALAALVCASPLDAALHDAFGKANGICSYDGYGADFMVRDLSAYLGGDFKGRWIADYLRPTYTPCLPVFHLVGGADALQAPQSEENPPEDGFPVGLDQWIAQDGVFCFKIKLQGTDIQWDVRRTGDVFQVAQECLRKQGRRQIWLSADSNEMNADPASVAEYLRKLQEQHPEAYNALRYIEQPIERDLNIRRVDMRQVAAMKPVLADEGITSVDEFRLARELGWSGVALKTCKGHSAALLYLAMAETYGMAYAVQDLTNPGISLIHSAGLAARTFAPLGFEYNARQYIPKAQPKIAARYSDIFTVKNGEIQLAGLEKTGLGYCLPNGVNDLA